MEFVGIHQNNGLFQELWEKARTLRFPSGPAKKVPSDITLRDNVGILMRSTEGEAAG